MKFLIEKASVRSVVVIGLVFGSFVLAVLDRNFRPSFGDLAKIGVGGYLGPLLPNSKKDT